MFTTAQCAELWHRYKAGESVDAIGRALGSVASTVRRELQYTGASCLRSDGALRGYLA